MGRITPQLVRKYFALPRAADQGGEGFFITTPAEDLEHDRIFPEGADLSAYLRNPVVLWLHDAYGHTAAAGIPVGTARSLEVIPGQGIRATGIDWLEGDPFVDRVRNAWDQRKIRGASIGFLPTKAEPNEFGGHDFLEWRLLEFSLVPVPANPEAVRGGLALAVKALGGEIDPALLTLPRAGRPAKGVSPRDVSRELADRDAEWSAPTLEDFTDERWEDLSEAEQKRITGHYAWAEKNPPDTFGGLKLPHHRAEDAKVVFRGVVSAMGVLLGARGGADIPEADRRPAFDHLASHYRQFSEEPPEFRRYTSAEWKALEHTWARRMSDAADLPAPLKWAPALALLKQAGTAVQTVILSKERFETQAEATAWIRDHDFVVPDGGPDETEHSWRYRQFPPGQCQEGALDNGDTFATIRLDDGVQAVVCKRSARTAFCLDPEAVKQAILGSFHVVR
jgi:hypothetical protein